MGILEEGYTRILKNTHDYIDNYIRLNWTKETQES